MSNGEWKCAYCGSFFSGDIDNPSNHFIGCKNPFVEGEPSRFTHGSAQDFACWLSVQPEVITVGAAAESPVLFEALRRYLDRTNLK